MIEKQDKKRLISNFLSLMSLQGVNYILPLLTFPYLVRVLGVDNFGLLAFATAFIAYFNIITSYGFDLTATKEVSIYRDNHDKLVEIYSSVMMIKFALIILSFIVMCVIVLSFERLSKDWEIYFLSFGVVVGQALFPVWLFQGLERMRYITYINILAKTIFTAAIFIFVHDQQDYFWVPLLTSAGYIIAGVYSLWIVNKIVGLKFKLQSKGKVLFYLNDGWHIFVTYLYLSIYSNTNIFLLGLLTSNIMVGYFSIAEKIIGAIGGIFVVSNQTLYPYLSKLFNSNKNQFIIFFKRIVVSYFAVAILFIILVLVSAKWLIVFINGSFNNDIIHILQLASLLLLAIPYGGLFAQTLNIFSLKIELKNAVRNTALISILIAPMLILLFDSVGLVVSMIICQLYLVVKYYKNINLEIWRINNER